MMERGGDVVTVVVPDRKSGSLLPQIVKHVKPSTEVHTDEWIAYGGLSTINNYWHKTVNHSAGQYVSSAGVGVNGLEGFWSSLKRAINGTHIHVSGKHLWKYAKEAEYRFNRRDCAESMFSELLGTFGPLPQRRD
jgi:transposase-like protein